MRRRSDHDERGLDNGERNERNTHEIGCKKGLGPGREYYYEVMVQNSGGGLLPMTPLTF
jgi:hypothetical protein